jgi:hypothetical protein
VYVRNNNTLENYHHLVAHSFAAFDKYVSAKNFDGWIIIIIRTILFISPVENICQWRGMKVFLLFFFSFYILTNNSRYIHLRNIHIYITKENKKSNSIR